MTQPLLAGPRIDDVTGVDLGRIEFAPRCSGNMAWNLQEVYNEATRRIGREQNVKVIDLARKLPKSSRFFYDFRHFTNAGAQAVADILSEDLCPFLANRFPAHKTSAGCSTVRLSQVH